MFDKLMFYVAVASFILGTIISYLCVLTFNIPSLIVLFNSNWAVLNFFWSFGTGLLGFAFGVMAFFGNNNTFKPLYINNALRFMLIFDILYLALTVFVGYGVIITGAYEISFARNYTIAYACVVFLSGFLSYALSLKLKNK